MLEDVAFEGSKKQPTIQTRRAKKLVVLKTMEAPLRFPLAI